METKAELKLKLISAALKRFEKNAEEMLKLGLDHAHWSGRLDAIRDIKDVLDEGKGGDHGDAAHPTTRA